MFDFSWGLFDKVVKLIKAWVPEEYYSNENKYRDDLMDYLYEHLNDKKSDMFGFSLNEDDLIPVRKEDGRSLCDIAVGNSEVGIELKKDLNRNKQSKIDRLRGQILRHINEYKEGVIVVLVGEVDKYAEAEIKDIIRSTTHADFGLIGSKRIVVINKSKDSLRKNHTRTKRKKDPFDFKLF